jgi:uncharacterized membrane protein
VTWWKRIRPLDWNGSPPRVFASTFGLLALGWFVIRVAYDGVPTLRRTLMTCGFASIGAGMNALSSMAIRRRISERSPKQGGFDAIPGSDRR